MAAVVLQFLLALAAGFFVFRLWRRVSAASRPIFWLVTVGTLVRAIGGLLGFWISYLELPVGRSLQLGRGLWFFGVDAVMYFDFSATAAARGPMAILFLDKGLPSPFFLQVLAGAILLLGAVSSVSILLNLVAYLASCRIILSFDSPEQRRFVVFAIAALSLAPSVVVWSLQPMKDVVFFFLIVAFFGSARKWQQLWSDPARPFPATGALLTWSTAMAVMLYGLSGIRWYFAFMVLLASLVFFLMTIISTRRRFAAAASALLLFVLLLSSFFAGAGSYVPPPIRAAVRNIHDTLVLPQTLAGLLASARRGFDRSGGATLIGAGGAIRTLDRNIGAKETPVVAAPAPLPARVQQRVGIDKKRTEDAAHPDAPSATASLGAKAPAATSTALPPAAVTATVAQQPEAAEEGEGASVSPGTVLMPGSTAGRLIAGTAAIVLPQWVARRIGVLDVRGGRGLWLFAEVDTIFFDVVLAFAIICMIRAARQRTLRAPVFWMIFVVTFTVGASLAYTVSNFGTLFRHRGMFLVGLILLPVAAAGSRRVQPATALEAGSTDVASV